MNIEYMIEDLLRENHLIFFTKNFLRRLPFESQWPPFSPSVNDNDTTQAVRAMKDIIFRKATTSIFLSADFISVTAKGL